jgi:ArsR family metal-binding transcriptional regulator
LQGTAFSYLLSQGKLITVHDDHIAINALQDAEEAEKIIQWLQKEINNAWERKDEITPSFQAAPRPRNRFRF